jgi:serine acetyltransferase
MTVGSGLVIVKAFDTFATAVTVPARHAAAVSALMMEEEGTHDSCDDQSGRNEDTL